MNIYFLSNSLFYQYKKTNNIALALKNYIKENELILQEIYFTPKKIKKNQIEQFINDKNYQKTVLTTIDNLQNSKVKEIMEQVILEIENQLQVKTFDKELYVIIGFNTTTIYQTQYQGKPITVLLLEWTLGIEQNSKMLLSHEATHWIRQKYSKQDIFETCVGERLITEGIAVNYSEQMVPGKTESYYCIVPDDTVQWVKQNEKIIEELIKGQLQKKELLYDLFYQFAKTPICDMPVRTGYVLGYLKVKQYLQTHKVTINKIISLDWREIING